MVEFSRNLTKSKKPRKLYLMQCFFSNTEPSVFVHLKAILQCNFTILLQQILYLKAQGRPPTPTFDSPTSCPYSATSTQCPYSAPYLIQSSIFDFFILSWQFRCLGARKRRTPEVIISSSFMWYLCPATMHLQNALTQLKAILLPRFFILIWRFWRLRMQKDRHLSSYSTLLSRAPFI